MDSGMDRARDRRNLLERLGAKVPGLAGYIEREMRREVDKMERDWLADQLDRVRGMLQDRVREWSRRGNLANLDLASSAEKLLDRLANRVRHADYGYTGFFDAVKIHEDELARLYEFDLDLIEEVEGLMSRTQTLPATASEDDVAALLDVVRSADRMFDERATVFEDVTRKGGR